MVAAEEGVGTSHESSPPASPPLPPLLSFSIFFLFYYHSSVSPSSSSLSSSVSFSLLSHLLLSLLLFLLLLAPLPLLPRRSRPLPWECVRSPKWRGRRICAKKGGRKKGREKEKKGIMFDRVRLCNVKSRVYYVEVEAKKQKKVKKKNTGGRKKGFLPCVSRHKDNNPRALLRQGQ